MTSHHLAAAHTIGDPTPSAARTDLLSSPQPTPLGSPQPASRPPAPRITSMYTWAKSMATVTTFGFLYICTSSGLIAYNKYLVHVDRFPYAVVLVLLHAGFASVFSFILYLIRPQWFPSLTDPSQKVSVDRDLILKGAVPIAFLFSFQLVLSNTAYLHSSVAFLQMMKEANLLLIYTLSLFAALERFSWRSVGILVFIAFATVFTVHGEMNFSLTGFLIQGISQTFECAKIVLQSMLLSNAGKKLDALSYVLLVMPICFLFLCAGLGGLLIMPHEHFGTPHFNEIVNWSPHLLANALIAFTLNVVIALFVKHSSAVAFVLAGIVKDAMIVATGAFLLQELISLLQVIGFTMQLCGILVWSLVKVFPSKFESGIFFGMADLLCGVRPAATGKPGEQCYGAVNDQTKGP